MYSEYVWLPAYKQIMELLENETKHELPAEREGSYAVKIPDELKDTIYPISEKKSPEDCWVFVYLIHMGLGLKIVTDYFIINEKTFKDRWYCPTLGAYSRLNPLTFSSNHGVPNSNTEEDVVL